MTMQQDDRSTTLLVTILLSINSANQMQFRNITIKDHFLTRLDTMNWLLNKSLTKTKLSWHKVLELLITYLLRINLLLGLILSLVRRKQPIELSRWTT